MGVFLVHLYPLVMQINALSVPVQANVLNALARKKKLYIKRIFIFKSFFNNNKNIDISLAVLMNVTLVM